MFLGATGVLARKGEVTLSGSVSLFVKSATKRIAVSADGQFGVRAAFLDPW